MHTIKRRLSILFFICSITGILLVTMLVNVTINKKFDEYISHIQDKRHENIVSYFEDIYNKQGKWTANSGVDLMHEAYMGNYCITLLDSNKKHIWGMNPNDIRLKTMPVKDRGVYNTKTFQIKSENKVVGYVEIGQYSSVLLSEEDMNFKTSINKSIMISGILTLIIIVIISLYFSRQFSIPIKEVANLSVDLSKGNFDAKSSCKSHIEELENLRESVNILAEKLKHQDSLRKRLVSDISHEIRAPLNVLQNNLEAMIDGVFPVTKERLNYLNEEVIRFGKLLNNLNILKEFESESIKINFQTVFLDELIKDIYNDFYVATENKNINFKYNIDKNDNYGITGDRDKLKQVFINLLSNSIKFTKDGGKILIKLYTKDKNIVVEVYDNGIGINREDLPFIFERFYRGDKSRNQFKGNGIGLTIVKNILNLHYASIDIESKEGKGTICKVYFNKNNS
ncbi:HAMP domain-containing sensor histidine kinase [Clostridium sp. Marseille-Q2269]|uniref:sensor histidine kinase n=1 Tax=Clostridium sp. Marseille-Q2269 TaxID=2942205 RepID=UPI0020744785|nr:HAMP domain-containing sensor histidine kinase [Clostridium sp. Marseille-Q2269]